MTGRHYGNWHTTLVVGSVGRGIVIVNVQPIYTLQSDTVKQADLGHILNFIFAFNKE